LQQTLDPLDIEGLNTLIQAQTGIDLLQASEEEISQALGGEITLDEYTTFVKCYLSYESSSSFTHPEAQSISTNTLLNEETPIKTLVIAYLLSASFKDCSMFITIKQQPDTHNGKHMDAYLVDVDVKSIKRLGRYAKLDRDLVQSFVKFESEGGRLEQCIV
jgi:inositol-pentakisphosphate 2-kinase